jgi:type IV pilus assembly protein PilE
MSQQRTAANLRNRRLSKIAGVTLLELMAVVMVVGILGIIALPSYRQYSMRAQRTDAKNALLRLATNQERFYLANRRYGGTADLANPILGFATALSEKGAYAITVPVANATTYSATATAVSGGAIDQTADTECRTFTITAQGVRTATPDPNNRCW